MGEILSNTDSYSKVMSEERFIEILNAISRDSLYDSELVNDLRLCFKRNYEDLNNMFKLLEKELNYNVLFVTGVIDEKIIDYLHRRGEFEELGSHTALIFENDNITAETCDLDKASLMYESELNKYDNVVILCTDLDTDDLERKVLYEKLLSKGFNTTFFDASELVYSRPYEYLQHLVTFNLLNPFTKKFNSYEKSVNLYDIDHYLLNNLICNKLIKVPFNYINDWENRPLDIVNCIKRMYDKSIITDEYYKVFFDAVSGNNYIEDDMYKAYCWVFARTFDFLMSLNSAFKYDVNYKVLFVTGELGPDFVKDIRLFENILVEYKSLNEVQSMSIEERSKYDNIIILENKDEIDSAARKDLYLELLCFDINSIYLKSKLDAVHTLSSNYNNFDLNLNLLNPITRKLDSYKVDSDYSYLNNIIMRNLVCNKLLEVPFDVICDGRYGKEDILKYVKK